MTAVAGTFLALQVLPDGPGPDLFVVGDSVTYLSAGSIQEEFPRDHLQFVAKPGFSSTMLLPLVDDAMGADGEPGAAREHVVALVGYNDVRLREVNAPALRELVDRTAEFRCGVWLTLPVKPGGVDNANPMAESDLVAVWNARLVDEVARHPNLHLVDDWQRAVEAAPEGKLLKADGVHPNEAGQRELAAIYRSALDRHC